MRGVTITDKRASNNVLAFDLRDVLAVLEAETRSSQWRLRDVEAVGAKAAELHRLADEGNPISGEALLSLSADIEQTIDGIFEAYYHGSESPWLLVRAVDAAAFDVESDENTVLEKIRRAFSNVRDLPN